MRSFLNIYRVIDYDMIRHVFKNNHQMSLVSQAAWTIGPSRINWRNGWNQRQEEGRELGEVLVDLWDSDGNLSAKHVELHGSHGHPWPKVSQFTSMKKRVDAVTKDIVISSSQRSITRGPHCLVVSNMRWWSQLSLMLFRLGKPPKRESEKDVLPITDHLGIFFYNDVRFLMVLRCS